MVQRRYGPVQGAGTVIIEKDAEKTIEKGSLGTTVYMGILEKGPVNKLFRCSTKKDFISKAGSYIDESFVPDAAFDFFNLGRAAGDLYCVRITDGTEVQSEVSLYGRKNTGVEKTLSDDCSGQYLFVSMADYLALGSPKQTDMLTLWSEDLGSSGILKIEAIDLDTPAVGTVRISVDQSVAHLSGDTVISYSTTINPEVCRFKAANGGRWGGKKDILFGTEFGVGGLTAFSFDTGKTMLEDYFIGAKLRFSALPGKSYTVVSNDVDGVLYVSADSTMDTDYAASSSSDETWSVQLVNNGKALAVKIIDGVSYPNERFGVEIYVDGVRVLLYDDLTLDPTHSNYYKNWINDDDVNVYVEVEDLWFGAYTPDVRPANIFGQNFGITNTVLTGRAIATSFEGVGDGSIESFVYGGNVQQDVLEIEVTNAGSQAEGSIQITNNVFDLTAAILTGDDVTVAYPLGDFTGSAHDKFSVNLYGQGAVEVSVSLVACTTGAATAAELESKINDALTLAGKVGLVSVVWDTDHFIVTSEGKGKDLSLVVADTGAPGGSLATELKLTAATYASYTIGTGDVFRITFDGVVFYDFPYYSGVTPAKDGKVQVGASVGDTVDNIVSAIEAYAAVDAKISAVANVDTAELTARTPSVATAWALTEVDGATDNMTIVTFAGGADQEWSYTSQALGLIASAVPISGVAFSAPNDFGLGFTISSGTTLFSLGDKFTIIVKPWEVDSLVGGWLYPDVLSAPRSKYQIISNTANTITVKSTSAMLDVAKLGSTYRVEYEQEFAGGYDGIVGITDINYLTQLDSAESPINNLFGEKKGLVKIGIPGVTSIAVQKAGLAYAEARNYQFRVQIPSNIVSEDSAEAYINETIGRNDFGVVSFPSWGYVPHPTSSGLKLIPNIGAIHGREALIANNYAGYHKAAAGIDVTIANCVKLPTGDKVLNEETLNKNGIGVIKWKSGNVIIWGDRTLALDPAWKWKHQRETMSYYENDLRESFDWLIFAINDPIEQGKAYAALYSYFVPEYQKRAVRGDTFEQAVQIKLDAENNTKLTMANGEMNAEIGLRLADTVERFIITMSKLGIFD